MVTIHPFGYLGVLAAFSWIWYFESGAHSPKMQQAACFPITLMLEPKSWP